MPAFELGQVRLHREPFALLPEDLGARLFGGNADAGFADHRVSPLVVAGGAGDPLELGGGDADGAADANAFDDPGAGPAVGGGIFYAEGVCELPAGEQFGHVHRRWHLPHIMRFPGRLSVTLGGCRGRSPGSSIAS